MRLVKTFLVIIIASFCWVSCSPLYYEPSSHLLPNLDEKGDLNIMSMTTLSADKGELQGAYACTDHIGVLATVMRKTNYFNINSRLRNSHMFEGGVGFYDNPTAEISYGLYGIIGKGAFENNIQRVSQGTESLTSNMTKYALQGNFGYSHTFYEVDYSFRPTWVSYTNLIGDLEIGGVLQSELLGNRRRHLLFEHALTMKVGNDQVKMMLQVGKGGRKFTYYTNRSKSYLSFGMLLDIYSSSKRWF